MINKYILGADYLRIYFFFFTIRDDSGKRHKKEPAAFCMASAADPMKPIARAAIIRMKLIHATHLHKHHESSQTNLSLRRTESHLHSMSH